MDPDMVRQQEEAETATRQRGPAAARPAAQSPHGHNPFVLRADPRGGIRPPRPVRPKSAPGWGAALRGSFFCLIITALALVAGIMIGVKIGLVAWQSLGIGIAAGFLLGWQSAVAALRRRYQLSLTRALRATIVPTALILFALVLAMATAALFMDISPTALSDSFLPSYWITVGIGGLIGFVLATIRMHGNLRH